MAFSAIGNYQLLSQLFSYKNHHIACNFKVLPTPVTLIDRKETKDYYWMNASRWRTIQSALWRQFENLDQWEDAKKLRVTLMIDHIHVRIRAIELPHPAEQSSLFGVELHPEEGLHLNIELEYEMCEDSIIVRKHATAAEANSIAESKKSSHSMPKSKNYDDWKRIQPIVRIKRVRDFISQDGDLSNGGSSGQLNRCSRSLSIRSVGKSKDFDSSSFLEKRSKAAAGSGLYAKFTFQEKSSNSETIHIQETDDKDDDDYDWLSTASGSHPKTKFKRRRRSSSQDDDSSKEGKWQPKNLYRTKSVGDSSFLANRSKPAGSKLNAKFTFEEKSSNSKAIYIQDSGDQDDDDDDDYDWLPTASGSRPKTKIKRGRRSSSQDDDSSKEGKWQPKNLYRTKSVVDSSFLANGSKPAGSKLNAKFTFEEKSSNSKAIYVQDSGNEDDDDDDDYDWLPTASGSRPKTKIKRGRRSSSQYDDSSVAPKATRSRIKKLKPTTALSSNDEYFLIPAKVQKESSQMSKLTKALKKPYLMLSPAQALEEPSLRPAKSMKRNQKDGARFDTPPQVKILLLEYLTLDQVLASFERYERDLDKLFNERMYYSETLGYMGITLKDVQEILNANIRDKMMQKLVAKYYTHSKHTSLVINGLLPLWIILLFADTYKLSHVHAVRQIMCQTKGSSYLKTLDDDPLGFDLNDG